MDFGLKGKVAIVGGASQGLGLAAAETLAREGARLAICSRDQAKIDRAADKLRQETGADVLAVAADTSRADDLARFADAALAHYGTVHVLVNNTGGPRPGHFRDLADADWDATHSLTLMSVVRLTRAVLPAMQKQRWGRVINIQSSSVKTPVEGLTLSNSVRLAVIGWAKSLSNEVGPFGITVNTVCPGFTRTARGLQVTRARAEALGRDPAEIERAFSERIPLRRMGEPEELASLIAYLASEQAGYITGTAIQVDGGASQAYT